MASNSREKFLFLVVFISIAFFGGSYAYQSFGDNVWLQISDIDERLETIDSLLENQKASGAIIKRYEEMSADLVVPGEDSEQLLAIREQITSILDQVGLTGRLSAKEPEKAEDFKIITHSIDDIECTPDQLGQLLYLIEKQSAVMEVTQCNITNQIRDNGEMGYRRAGDLDENTSLLQGLLSVDLEVSRLVEYRKGEKPTKKRARRRA